jgi:hypothetical protein
VDVSKLHASAAADTSSAAPLGPELGSAAGLARVAPSLPQAIGKAEAALAQCADLVAVAACKPARVYLDAARGNVRHALSALVHRHPHLAMGEDFETSRWGEAEVIGCCGFPDTVLGCVLPDGSRDTVRAIIPARRAERAAWLRPMREAPGVWMRGRVAERDGRPTFVDDVDLELPLAGHAGPDLGRDLVSSGLNLASRPVLAVSLEVTLAAGSWRHLDTGRRWYADHATARAVVRLLGGAPAAGGLHSGVGGLVDYGALVLIERLGWRHWPTPGVG